MNQGENTIFVWEFIKYLIRLLIINIDKIYVYSRGIINYIKQKLNLEKEFSLFQINYWIFFLLSVKVRNMNHENDQHCFRDPTSSNNKMYLIS